MVLVECCIWFVGIAARVICELVWLFTGRPPDV